MKTQIDYCNEMQDALKVSVKIDHGEILKVVVNDLISKRNSSKEPETVKAFDLILNSYYLMGDEFERFVINKDPLD